jgi:oxygen-dependent protoporphyrinogen oxidase
VRTLCPALVVGGGISGLVCAYALRKAGIDAQLLEASARPGGVIQSMTRDGFLLELGPQSFTGVPAVQDLCHELGIENQLVHAPRSPRFILIDGLLQPVPLTPLAFFTSSLLGIRTKWSILREAFGHSAPPEKEETIAALVRRKFTPELLERIVGPFVSGVYAGDPEELSFRAAFPQLHDAEARVGSIVRGVARLGRQPKRSGEPRPALFSFRNGNETLVRALSAEIGPALRTNVRVVRVARQNDASFDVGLENHSQAESISTRALILATPTDVAGDLLVGLDMAFQSLLRSVEYAPVGVVSLGYRQSDIGHSLGGFGFLVPRSAGLRVLGTVWNSSLFPDRAPSGHALLTSFVGGTSDPGAVELAPEQLAKLVHTEISPLLLVAGEPVFSNVTVWRRALPQYNLGHGGRLDAARRLLEKCPGIWLTGNYVRGPAIGSCVEQALAVAEEVQRALKP